MAVAGGSDFLRCPRGADTSEELSRELVRGVTQSKPCCWGSGPSSDQPSSTPGPQGEGLKERGHRSVLIHLLRG